MKLNGRWCLPMMLFTISSYLLFVESLAHAGPRPTFPGGVKLSPGQVPHTCSEGDLQTGASAYGSNYGYYFEKQTRRWVTAPWCFPRWGNLVASSPIITKRKKKTVTVYATPTDGSNSAEYAPVTKTISWTYPGKAVSGCTSESLFCTFIPFAKQTSQWQWAEVHVSMPRTFFIDSRGSNCAGLHLCPGFTTNAWSFVGIAPKAK